LRAVVRPRFVQSPVRSYSFKSMSLAYSIPFVLLAAIPALFYFVCPLASIGAIAGLLALLLSFELALPRRRTIAPTIGGRGYRFIPVLYIPAQLGMTAWAIIVVGHLQLSYLSFAGLALTVGVMTGVFGMLAAHEMVHSPLRRERILGVTMLTGMMYRHFRIAHIYGHHRWAATNRDAATAHLTEGFYAYLARTIPQQFGEAMRFERRRCAQKRWAFARNRVHQDVLVILLVSAAALGVAGRAGLEFYMAESFVAIVVLELFNYIAHYGLTRERTRMGGFERASDWHSWNSSNAIANKLLLNMGRHSDHHRRPSAAYQLLQPVAEAPELPLGYSGSILLAAIPPLWRRVMDPRVLRARAAR
jgi:alkane 1-monooxygenase